MSSPSRRRLPAVGRSRPSTMRASVVLPLPDCPKSVKTSGLLPPSVRLTSRTAATRRRRNSPPKVLDTPRSSSSGAILCRPSNGETGDAMLARNFGHLGDLAPAAVHRQGAARVKAAPRRRLGKVRGTTGQRDLGRVGANARQAGDQVLGIGVLRGSEQTLRRRLLDQTPPIHDAE